MLHSSAHKRRLLFLTVNCSYSHSSLALPLLHSVCRDLSGWEWLRYDMTIASDVMSAVRDIAAYNCDLLVTDLYLFNRPIAMDVLQRCHSICPECRIAVGGPECLGKGAEELRAMYPWLDCIFRGEGESIFRDYLRHFEDENYCPGGILPEDGNGVFTQWASSDYPVNDPFFVADKPFVQIETSRGCPMGCFYCTSGGTSTRYRTLEQVREELQLLAAVGVKEIRVLDRTFNLPQERGAALLRMFREEFPGMKFHLELHPQFLNASLRSELKLALPGQLHIEVGVQCLDRRVQELSGRRSDSKLVLDGLAFLTGETAFEIHTDLLSGMPGQTRQNILDDTAELMKLAPAEIQLEVLKALPGTPLRDIAAEHGLVFSESVPYDVMKTDSMSIDDIQNSRDLSRLLDLTYNHPHLHPAVLAMCRECPDFTVRLLDFFHRSGGDARVVWDLKKRFLFLLDFCRCYQLAASQFELAYQWLLAGYPPSQGPDVYTRKSDKVPPEAWLSSGDPACAGCRDTRYWVMAGAERMYCLAYNRAYSLNRPAAVWQIGK